MFILNTSLALSAMVAPNSVTRLVNCSFHRPNVDTKKSYNPPIAPALSSNFTLLPPDCPDTSTCVVAVASGKGYLPCMSLTKYLRKGIRNNIPSTPPSREARNTSIKFTAMSGYSACSMYRAGSVNMAPATTPPEQAPMLCIITFSPMGFLRLAALDTPTAIIAIGMAASNTWPTLRPRYAVAAENTTAITSPHVIDHAVVSRGVWLAGIIGVYVSPGFSSRNAFSGSDACCLSSFVSFSCCMSVCFGKRIKFLQR